MECINQNDGKNIPDLTSPVLLTGRGWIPLNNNEVLKSSVVLKSSP